MDSDARGFVYRSLARGDLWLLAVVVVAAVIRLWRVPWGLPYLYDGDEITNLTHTLTMIREGDLNPHFFNYGSLFLYLNAVVILVVGWVGRVFGAAGFESIDLPETIAFASGYLPDQWPILLARSVSVVASVVTVIVIYRTVRRLTQSPPAAALAGALYAVAPIAVTEGRLFTPNALSGLFGAATFYWALRVYEEGTRRSYLVAGIMLGLATGTKYNAVLVGVSIVVAHILRRREGLEVWVRGPLTAIYASLGTFLVTTPFSLLAPGEFLTDVGYELTHYSGGHLGAEEGVTLYLRVLAVAFSTTILLMPFGFTDRRYRSAASILVGSGLIYVTFLSLMATSFARNLLPVLPAFAAAAGIGAVAAISKVRLDRPSRNATVWSLSVLALLVASSVTVADSRDLEDRSAARDWVEANVAPGTAVHVDAYTPWVDPDTHSVSSELMVAATPLPDDWDYLIVTPRGSGRLAGTTPALEARLEELRQSTCLVETFASVAEIRVPAC